MKWDVRLEGGPADGDKAECDGPLPSKVFTTYCGGCVDWHWFSTPTEGAEVYEQAEFEPEAKTAKYVYADLTVRGGGDIDERVRHPGPRELVPA